MSAGKGGQGPDLVRGRVCKPGIREMEILAGKVENRRVWLSQVP